MKAVSGFRLLAVVATATLISACGHSDSNQASEDATRHDAGAPEHIQLTREQWESMGSQRVDEAVFEDEERTEAQLTFDDDLTTPVFSPFSGPVTRVWVKEGDTVKRGDPLVSVSASEWFQAHSDLLAASAASVTAQAQLKQAEANQARLHELVLGQSAAEKDWLQSQTDLVAAKSSAASAQAALESVRSRLRVMGASPAQIQALEKPGAKDVGDEAIVRAPVEGTVTQRQVGVGQFLNSVNSGGSNPVITLRSLRRLWVVGDVHEFNATHVRPGQRVKVEVGALPQTSFDARVVSVGTSLDPASHRLPVRAEVDNAGGVLRPMMSASLLIALGNARRALAVPEVAIVHMGSESRVYVVSADHQASIRVIHTGRVRSDGLVEVTGGLAAGEQVITNGALFIDRAITTNGGDKP